MNEPNENNPAFMLALIGAAARAMLAECGPVELHAANGHVVEARAEAARIAELEAKAAAAEERTLQLKIQLALKAEELRASQSAESRRRERDADAAIERLVVQGKLPDDLIEQWDWKMKFIADPSLIRLAVAGLRKNRIRI